MTRRFIPIFAVLILSLLVVAISCAPAAEKVKPAEFYKGETTNWIVCDSAGTSSDLIARLLAPRFEQLTGATAVITNMKGAGGLEGYSHVYHAKPDGLTLGGQGLSLVIALNKIMDEPGADFDPEKFSYILGMSHEPHVFFVDPKGPYQSIAALQGAKGIKLGGSTPGGNISLAGMSVIHLLDLDTKIIVGIKGIEGCKLAIAQGQVCGVAFALGSVMRDVESGVLRPLFVIGSERVKELPDTPTLTELVSVKGEKLELIKIWDNLSLNRLTFAPPGVPSDRVKFLRETFDKITDDPEIVKRIEGVTRTTAGRSRVPEIVERIETLMKDKDKIKAIFSQLVERYRA